MQHDKDGEILSQNFRHCIKKCRASEELFKRKKKLKKTVGKESPQFEYGTGLRMLEIIAALD